MSKFKDITNQKFGRLTAMEMTDERRHGEVVWVCKCDCGNEIKTRIGCLTSGSSKSCGCWKKDRMNKHDMHGTSFYNIWQNIKQRCFDKNHHKYPNYGGRGIGVCDRWKSFDNFKEDMYDSYLVHEKNNDSSQIERKNNDGDYCPENCEWATRKEQARNRRDTRWVEYNGDKKSLAEWVEILDLDYNTTWQRIVRHGWTPKKAFNK